MAQFINTNKEYYWGDWYFKTHVMAPGFDYKAHKKELSPYYERYGFKVSMMFADFFSSINGISSDRYLSMDVYYFFVVPSLNRYDFINAYLDKNIYTDLFPDVRQPESVVKNMHGHFYNAGEEISIGQAVDIVAAHNDELIIKPTVATCNGDGVEQIDTRDTDRLLDLFKHYDINFTVQKKVKQHPEIQRVNPTSLNSIRLYTYRKTDGEIVFFYSNAMLRYGGKGAIKDNTSKGGGTCLIDREGRVDDRVFRFQSMEVSSLQCETGVSGLVIPNYAKAVNAVMLMHRRLPYFDYVGWDVTILPDGNPLLIEYNLVPGIEGPQIMAGPMFGEHLDEVIERACQVECSRVQTNKKVFARDSHFYLHAQ